MEKLNEENNNQGIWITRYKLRRTFEQVAIVSFGLDYLLGAANTLIIGNLGKATFLNMSPQTMLWLAQTGITATDYIGIPIIALWVYLYITEDKLLHKKE